MEQMFDVSSLRETRDTTIPRFYLKTMIDERESRKQGHQIFIDVEMVEIITPGDKLNVPHCVVSEYHRQRYKTQYESWKSGNEQKPDGFRLEAWPHCTSAEAEALKAVNCFTVEQLAAMAEANRPKIPTFHSLQKKAQEFLEAQKDDSKIVAMQTMIDDLKNQVQHLANMNDGLKKKVSELEVDIPETPKRRGRPPKT